MTSQSDLHLHVYMYYVYFAYSTQFFCFFLSLFFLTIYPIPPLSTSLSEETGEPGENPRLSAECWPTLTTYDQMFEHKIRTLDLRGGRQSLWRQGHWSPWARSWSTVGRMYLSRFTAWFGWLWSAQILILSFDFGTTTICAHHSVGSVTLLMSPSASSLSRSIFLLWALMALQLFEDTGLHRVELLVVIQSCLVLAFHKVLWKVEGDFGFYQLKLQHQK